MATSVHHHAPTVEQRQRLHEDIADIDGKLQSVTTLVRACYGPDSQPAIRADEVAGAVQRLKWELERRELKTLAATV